MKYLLLQLPKVQRGLGLRLDLLAGLQEHLPVLAGVAALEVVDHGRRSRLGAADLRAAQVAARHVLLHGGEVVPHGAGTLPAGLWLLEGGGVGLTFKDELRLVFQKITESQFLRSFSEKLFHAGTILSE